MTRHRKVQVTVRVWEAILWLDHGHGRQYEHVLDWLKEQAGLDAGAGLSDYNAVAFDANEQILTIELTVEEEDDA